MTTQTWSSVVDHSSDAGFRAWGAEIGTNFTAVGLVNTADTGQINWATVTRPGTSTAGGYEIWRFADSSLYMKIEYGTSPTVTNPQMWVTVGTGSNGSGTITGQTSTRNIFTCQQAPNSTTTVYTSYLCRVADGMSLQWKVLANGGISVFGLLAVGKTVDGTGAATSTGFGVLRIPGNAATQFQSVRTASTAVTYTDSTVFAVIPGSPASSIDASGNYQAYEVWMNTPSVTSFIWANVVVLADIARGFTFSVAMVGSTARAYMSVGQMGTSITVGAYTGAYASFGVIYE